MWTGTPPPPARLVFLLPICRTEIPLQYSSNRKEATEENRFQTFGLAVTVSLFGSIPKVHLLVTMAMARKSYRRPTNLSTCRTNEIFGLTKPITWGRWVGGIQLISAIAPTIGIRA